MSKIEDEILARWAAANKVAKAANAKRNMLRAIAVRINSSNPPSFLDVTKDCMKYDAELDAALDTWVALGGE